MGKVLTLYTLAQKWQICQESIEWHNVKMAYCMVTGDQEKAQYHQKQIEAYRELQISLTSKTEINDESN